VSQLIISQAAVIDLGDFGLFWVLAEACYGREVTMARLEDLAQV
jgi:hypothetical protein